MNRILIFAIIFIFFIGCASSLTHKGNFFGESEKEEQAILKFNTNRSNFLIELTPNISKEKRNEFIDEFILKSDIQCQEYLNNHNNNDKNKIEDEVVSKYCSCC